MTDSGAFGCADIAKSWVAFTRRLAVRGLMRRSSGSRRMATEAERAESTVLVAVTVSELTAAIAAGAEKRPVAEIVPIPAGASVQSTLFEICPFTRAVNCWDWVTVSVPVAGEIVSARGIKVTTAEATSLGSVTLVAMTRRVVSVGIDDGGE